MSLDYTTASCGCCFNKDEHGNLILDLSVENINFECQATWKLLSDGKTKGIFQLESNLGRHFAKSLKPENIEQLSALLALLRPGSLEAMYEGKSMTQHYIDRKNGKDSVTYLHDALRPALQTTYGVLTYQEQSMQIARDIAGFDLQAADILRRAIGKKKPELMAKLKQEFLDGCKKVGTVSDEEAITIFDWIEKSQRYSFNKCISGSSRLYRQTGKNRYHPTVQEMYRIRNDIKYAKKTGHLSLYKKWKLCGHYGYTLSLCEDGRIRPNIIKNIYFSGYKHTWRITLEDGKFIDVTDNHKFPTQRGKVSLSRLSLNDQLFIKLPYDITPTRKYNWSQATVEDIRNRKIQHDHVRFGFMTGENNPGYVNGEYTKWKQNTALLEDVCSDCNKEHRRLEVHHIDGNRENNKLDNLIKLCPSCHKKREYAIGRTKKGEKGYPSTLIKIKSIKLVGEEPVYDIEMEGPNHNFVTNQGIVSCNSHSMSYAYNAYFTAYCKAHFKRAFYTSWLFFAKSKPKFQEEVEALIDDARANDVTIAKPSLQKLNANFKLIDNTIYFGITDIKSVGKKVYEKMLQSIDVGETYLRNFSDQHVQYSSELEVVSTQPIPSDFLDYRFSKWYWLDVLLLLLKKTNKKAVESLILAGALDYLELGREVPLHQYQIFMKLKPREQLWIHNYYFQPENYRCITLLQCLQALLAAPTGKSGGIYHKSRVPYVNGLAQSYHDPGYEIRDIVRKLAIDEESLLGVSITTHKTDQYDITSANCTCLDFLKGKVTKNIILAVFIKNCREYICDKGNNKGRAMAFLQVSDNSCVLDNVAAFPDTYDEYKDRLEAGNVALLIGNKSKSRDTFIIDKVLDMQLI